jgi:hypothetical protein
MEWLRPAYPKIVFTTDLQYCSPVSVVFCDGRPLGSAARWTELQLMFFLQRGSRPIPGWTYHQQLLSQTLLGGCSDASQRVFCMAREGATYVHPSSRKILPGCVYTIASDTIDSGRIAKAPDSRRLPACIIVKVGKSVYHGGGLFPSTLKEHPIFLLPSMLSPTQWCRRRLTLEETWGVYDAPHHVVTLLRRRPSVAAWIDCRCLLPGRCLEYGVCHLLTGIGGRIEGGELCLRDQLAKDREERVKEPSNWSKKKGQDLQEFWVY